MPGVPIQVKEILGSVVVQPNTPVTTDALLAQFPTATLAKMKTEGVRVSVDGYPMFPATYDADDYITSGHTLVFDKETILLIGVHVTIP